jgi:hypothetical protein
LSSLARHGARGAILGAVLLCLVGEAEARDPKTRLIARSGWRQNTGELGRRYGFGWLVGFDASYMLLGPIGITSSFGYTRFDSSDPSTPEGQLSLVELGLGLRGHLKLGSGDLQPYFYGEGGADMVRSSIPLDPGDRRSHVVPVVGGGIEVWISDFLLSVGARAGVAPRGPSGLTLQVGIGFGGR